MLVYIHCYYNACWYVCCKFAGRAQLQTQPKVACHAYVMRLAWLHTACHCRTYIMTSDNCQSLCCNHADGCANQNVHVCVYRHTSQRSSNSLSCQLPNNEVCIQVGSKTSCAAGRELARSMGALAWIRCRCETSYVCHQANAESLLPGSPCITSTYALLHRHMLCMGQSLR
jgi:hypothetical protein